MASAPGSGRRPFRRFFARLMPRSLRPGLGRSPQPPAVGATGRTGIVGGLAPGGPSAAAGITDGLRVRAPWSILRWFRQFRGRAAGRHTPGGTGATALSDPARRTGPGGPGPREVGAAARGMRPGPMGLGRTARPSLISRAPLLGGTRGGSLAAAPPDGPDVRPGHDLRMPPGPGAFALHGPGGGTESVSRPAGESRPALRPAGGGGEPAGLADSLRTRTGSLAAATGTGPEPTVAAGLADALRVRSGYLAGAPGETGQRTDSGRADSGRAGAGQRADRGLVRDGHEGHAHAELPGHGPGGLARRGGIAGRRGLAAAAAPSLGPAAGPVLSGSVLDGLAVGGRVARVTGDGRDAAEGPRTAPGRAKIDADTRGRGPLVGRPAPGPVVSNPHAAGDLRVLGAATLPPGSEPDPRGAVTVGPPVAPRAATPRERWEAAVAARPLESPRALPTAFHAMATAITGRARPPLFTAGPNTRRALAAAGALGATTGTVVHLPAVPTSAPAVSAVLAHELTHTRSPVRRPRFLLDGASALLDDDERQALSAGRDRLGQAATTGAGIVDSLPVGGGGLGAVSEVATKAARAAILEATASPLGSALSGMPGAVTDFAQSAMSSASGAIGSATGAVTEAASGAASAVSGAASAVSDAVGGIAGGAAQAAGGGAKATPIDPDQVVEIVERRLLREIERRGGRWAGVF